MAPYKIPECKLYSNIIDELEKDMVVFADRNFYGFDVWLKSLDKAGALIWRVSKCVNFPVESRLDDGSYISIVKPSRKAVKLNPPIERKTHKSTCCRILSCFRRWLERRKYPSSHKYT